MNVLSGGLQSIQKCAAILRSGELLAIPTETVYGLAANATDEKAVAKIFAAKNRPEFDPLIVHIPMGWGSLKKLDELGITDSSLLSDQARSIAEILMKSFWPGPLTLVLPRGSRIPDLVTSGLTTVGIRMPKHSIAQDLLKTIQLPLAAPSANRFGRISPTTTSAVISELGDKVGYVLEGGPCEVGLESTILHVAPDATLTLLRPGAVSREALANASCRSVATAPVRGSEKSTAELAPGMLASHYAPQKPLVLGAAKDFSSHQSQAGAPLRWGVLYFDPASLEFFDSLASPNRDLLSPTGDWSESARRLFGSLRKFDEDSKIDRIFAEDPSKTRLDGRDTGVATAILDRLTRAAAKS